jgi:hypothetical protein
MWTRERVAKRYLSLENEMRRARHVNHIVMRKRCEEKKKSGGCDGVVDHMCAAVLAALAAVFTANTHSQEEQETQRERDAKRKGTRSGCCDGAVDHIEWCCN